MALEVGWLVPSGIGSSSSKIPLPVGARWENILIVSDISQSARSKAKQPVAGHWSEGGAQYTTDYGRW